MVLESNSGDALEIYVDLYDQNNKPILVVLRLDVESSISGRNGEPYVVNSIRSIYGKDNVNTPINKIDQGYGRYVHLKRLEAWVRATGASTPSAGALKTSEYTIIDKSDIASVDLGFSGKIQPQGNTLYKGVFLADFERCHQSLIGLFNGADASTLPHESAHWLKAAMEDLIGAGLANDKMVEDMNTINTWLDKQDYTGMDENQKAIARDEYFARAFEMYLREGKFPETSNNKLRAALHRLANALKTIYRNALALNAPIDDSVRAFFDGLFAVDQTVEDTSILDAILRVVDAGAIALPKDAMKDVEKGSS